MSEASVFTLFEGYHTACKGRGVLVPHLPVLRYYGSQCESIADVGCRDGSAALTFLNTLKYKAAGRYVALDTQGTDAQRAAERHGREENVEHVDHFNWTGRGDLQAFVTTPVDLVFIDLQERDAMFAALNMARARAAKYMIVHGSKSVREVRELVDIFNKRVQDAAEPTWARFADYHEGSGMVVFKRKAAL